MHNLFKRRPALLKAVTRRLPRLPLIVGSGFGSLGNVGRLGSLRITLIGRIITARASSRSMYERPSLEALNDRLVPSTLAFTNNLDSGSGSLRGEIAAARSGDDIAFAPSLDGQTITLTSGESTVAKSLSIVGPDAGQPTISGDDWFRAAPTSVFQNQVICPEETSSV
jgi:hypothetical protein